MPGMLLAGIELRLVNFILPCTTHYPQLASACGQTHGPVVMALSYRVAIFSIPTAKPYRLRKNNV